MAWVVGHSGYGTFRIETHYPVSELAEILNQIPQHPQPIE